MPTLTRIFVKVSLLYLVLALAVGAMLSLGGDGWLALLAAHLRPVYYHLFMVGWVTQLIFGIAYWMLPKHSQDQPRGNEPTAWAVFWLLNAGLLLRAISEPLYGSEGEPFWGWALAMSAVLQWLAGVLFVIIAWPRLRRR